MALTDITRIEVSKAIEEYDRLGRDAFLRRYGFGRARRYLLLCGGRHYDSKAIVGAAHGYVPGLQPLAAGEFSGGAAHAVSLLRGLGFTVLEEMPESALLRDDLIDRVAQLKVNRSSGRPALFQPIVLLWAIGRARRGEPRLLSWRETEDQLTNLLQRHGMRGERPRPDYPVAALRRAGLWVLPDHQGTVPAAHGDTELRGWFRGNQPLGGLAEPVYDLLRRSGDTRLAVIGELLCRFFDDLDYGPLLTDVGLYDDDVAGDEPHPLKCRPRPARLLVTHLVLEPDPMGAVRVDRHAAGPSDPGQCPGPAPTTPPQPHPCTASASWPPRRTPPSRPPAPATCTCAGLTCSAASGLLHSDSSARAGYRQAGRSRCEWSMRDGGLAAPGSAESRFHPVVPTVAPAYALDMSRSTQSPWSIARIQCVATTK
ncbi:hypothetical protein J2Z21_002224 [Streptomyces griseochromogenes]|uniref:Uncharacterized protein n=1 Tax=Streptomyces griseochromogenes TaxID=68214 RepID=A0ABS4LPH4_9ACTN|nr:hypothetical protein [Streptomyces griseochromogenes]MBP2049293.1 hypothetical protein [Streptomyces griseochromogenes]